MERLPAPTTDEWLDLYLREDLDVAGDVTSDSIFPAGEQGEVRLVAREPFFAVGLEHARVVFERLGCKARVEKDVAWVDAGDVLLTATGPVRGLLAAERLALNLVARMGGIATVTRRLVEELGRECSGCRVAATRKTTPGFRLFEKEAVALAGGDPHRRGLWDEAMVKDNHREAAGSVAAAVARVRAAHRDLVVTAEVESLEGALAAAEAGAHWLLIDNQPPGIGKEWAREVWGAHPNVKIEASGGIRPENVLDYGWADRVSMGALTQAAPAADVSLEWGPAA
ncbi:MAG: carboxylating nicotinate-nucleotide diphosphorylase [Thermoplasmatota archaeon]